MKITIDFETRSTVDLLKSGPWKYAAHDSTDIICLSVRTGVVEGVWVPDWVYGRVESMLTLIPDGSLKKLIEDATEIEAHNFEFERAIWHHIMHKRYGFPDLDLNKCRCSAAMASAHGLPRKLEKACGVTKVSAIKDMDGHKLMLKMCKPRKPRKAEREADKNWQNKTYWHEKSEDILRLIEYCVSDTAAEAALSETLRPLSPVELEVWKLDQKINARGAHIDIESVRGIISGLEQHQKDLLNEMSVLTGGQVDSPRQVAALRTWLMSYGVETEDLQKNTVIEILKSNIPVPVRRVLEIRQELSKASTAKFTAMINRAEADNRARSLFMYHGATTGRWAAKAIQPQNMPRESYKGEELEQAYEAFKVGDIDYIKLFFDDPFIAASKCIRGSITAAPGHRLICADWNAVEARGNAWLAGERKVLDAFENGIDLYRMAAAGTFDMKYEDVPKDSHERTVGKVQILALGYQGGIGAFASMAGAYGIDLEALPALVMPYATEEELAGPYGAYSLAETYVKKSLDTMSYDAAVACDIVKRKWRADNAYIVSSWREYERAAFEAVSAPGTIQVFDKVKYRTWDDINGNRYLCCQLPSGRVLYYFDPQIRDVKTDWDDKKPAVTSMTVDSMTSQWVRKPLYGGLLCENVTQAVCRDLLAETLIRVEKAGYPVIMHVHDEIVCEVPDGFGSLKEFEKLMIKKPRWAAGFPLAAEGWEGKRFRK